MSPQSSVFLRAVISDLLRRHPAARGPHGRLLQGHRQAARCGERAASAGPGDSGEAAAEKLGHLARLLQLSQRTILVLDSSSLCPGLAATSRPGPLHRDLARLERAGLLHTAITLDPWALLQKAGFPQVEHHNVIRYIYFLQTHLFI